MGGMPGIAGMGGAERISEIGQTRRVEGTGGILGIGGMGRTGGIREIGQIG